MPLDLGDVFVLKLRDLKLDHAHPKCIVHLNVLQPWQPAGVSGKNTFATIVRDDDGNCTKLVLVENQLSFDAIRQRFPPSARVTVKEPWYKILADGTHGIRVEDSCVELAVSLSGKDVVKEELVAKGSTPSERGAGSSEKNAGPSGTVHEGGEQNDQLSAEECRQRGNALFKANDLDLALEMYARAVARDASGKIKHLCFSNRSLCYFKKKMYFVVCVQLMRVSRGFLSGFRNSDVPEFRCLEAD